MCLPEKAILKFKPSKSEILKDSIKYLERMVDKHGIRPDPDTVEAVLTWNSPETEHEWSWFRELLQRNH